MADVDEIINTTNERMTRRNKENSPFFKDYTSNNNKADTAESIKTEEEYSQKTVLTKYATNA